MLTNNQESKTMFMFPRPFSFERSRAGRFACVARRTVTMMVVLGAGVAVMGAQTSAPAASAAVVSSADDTSASLFPVKASDGLFSSSAEQQDPTMDASVVATTPNFAEMMQYGGGQRQRYGRPRYRGNNTNADGSSKWIFFGGAGLSQPIGNTWHYLTPSYGIQVGGGRQFNKKFAVPIEFDYDHFGFAKATLDNQLTLYNAIGAGFTTLDGSSHVWSFSVDPTYTFYSGDGLGAYVVAGAGFYHKTATFTVPGEGEYCDEFGYCYTYTANEPVDSYTSNAPGFSGGFGVTYKFSRFSNERFYIEARYVFVDNSQRYGYTVNDISTPVDSIAKPAYSASSPDPNNLYPANSNRTTFIPIKVGLRF
jgi:hypothetical protein